MKNLNAPMLTIIDDDGNAKFVTDLLPLIASKGISISSAVIANKVGTSPYMTWSQVEAAYIAGAEILSHTYNNIGSSDISEMTEQEVWYDYVRARHMIESHGIPSCKYLVYVGGSGSSEKANGAAKKVYDCAITAHSGATGGNTWNFKGSLNPYSLRRFRLDESGTTGDVNYNLDTMKALIDHTIQHGGWMIWMMHTSSAAWTETAKSTIESAIDYAIDQGLPIVSVDTGYKNYCV